MQKLNREMQVEGETCGSLVVEGAYTRLSRALAPVWRGKLRPESPESGMSRQSLLQDLLQ